MALRPSEPPTHARTIPAPAITIPQVSLDSTGSGPRNEVAVGSIFAGRYQIERQLAMGGMGRVYLASQLPLSRSVALKVIAAEKNTEEFRKRFLLEASACAQLEHRNIVVVHDYGETQSGEVYMAMEYIAGQSLSKVIEREGPLTPARTCRIALEIARALRTAHSKNLVHRDIKPSNVMIVQEDEDGKEYVKVLDFGLVKVFSPDGESDLDLTGTGTLLGSPRYMAPEQIKNERITPQTDIYSLGVLMFHMITQRPPYSGTSSPEILSKHLRDATPPLAQFLGRDPECPELELIIQRCMQKAPEDRYPSIQDLIDELKAAYRLMEDYSVSNSRSLSMSGRGPSVTGSIAIPGALITTQDGTGPAAAAFQPPITSVSIASQVIVTPPVRRWPMFVGAGLGALGLGAAVVVMLSTPAPAPAPAASPAPAAVAMPAPKPPAPRAARVRFESNPAGAAVWKGDQRVGTTPFSLEIPPTDEVVHAFTFKLAGHTDVMLSTTLRDAEQLLHAQLVPLPVPEAPRPAPKVAARPARERPSRPEPKAAPAEPAPVAVAPAPAPPPVEVKRAVPVLVDDAPRARALMDVESKRSTIVD